MMRIYLIPKWILTSGIKRLERKKDLLLRFYQICWKSIMDTSCSYQTEIWFPQEVSNVFILMWNWRRKWVIAVIILVLFLYLLLQNVKFPPMSWKMMRISHKILMCISQIRGLLFSNCIGLIEGMNWNVQEFFVFSTLDFVWKDIHDSEYYVNLYRKEKVVFGLRQSLISDFCTRKKD